MFSIVHLLLKVCGIIILNTPLCLLNVLQCVKIVLKEIGTIKRFYSVYDVYYGLLHFIQPSVITKCGFIPEKRS